MAEGPHPTFNVSTLTANIYHRTLGCVPTVQEQELHAYEEVLR